MVPIFALVLAVPALERLLALRPRPRTLALGAIALVTLVQAAAFARAFAHDGTSARRRVVFQADFPSAWEATLRAGGQAPIWLLDRAYVHGVWRAVLDGVPRARLVHWARPPEIDREAAELAQRPQATQFDPPAGAAVVAGAPSCATCTNVYIGSNYNAWIQR
jgi:hypothetical protein